MSYDTPPTRMIFRTFRKGGDVIALMPDLTHSAFANGGQVTSYQHLGQHGGADYPHVMRATRPATDEEVAPLLRELTSIGYRVNRITRRQR